MRITGGVWASRRVRGLQRGSAIRPTPDALREQAFAILAAELEDAVVVDLFAGTGIVTLEALSRGARLCYAVEKSRQAALLLAGNLALLEGAAARCEIIVKPALAAIHELAQRGVQCRTVWCDPPFADWEAGIAALEEVRERGVLVVGGRAVLELPTARAALPRGFEVERQLRGACLLRCTGEG